MRKGSLGLAGIILLATSMAAVAVVFPLTVEEVAVLGNQEIRTREVFQAVPFGAGDAIEESELRSAAQAIHDLGWFSEVSWDPAELEQGRVVFVVHENPVIEKIVITGNDHRNSFHLLGVKLYDARIVSSLKIRQILWGEDIRRRKVLNLPALTRALEEILDEYQRRGFMLVSIGKVDAEAILQIEIVEHKYAGSLIHGLRTVPADVAQALIEIPLGEPVRLMDLQKAAAQLRESIYFTTVDVAPQAGIERTKIWLRWTLGERQLIQEPVSFSSVIVEGGTVYDRDLLESMVGEIPEGPTANFALLEIVREIHDLYRRDGYSLAELSVMGAEEGILRIHIAEGIIGSITLEGAQRTRDYVVERNIALSVGDVFNRKDLVVSYQQLMSLDYFSAVDFVPSWVDGDVNVAVSISDKKTLGSFGGSVAVDPQTGSLYGELKLNQKNLFGTGQDVELSYNRGLIAIGDDRPSTWNLGYSTVAYFPGFDRVGLDLYQKTREVSVDDETDVHLTIGAGLSVLYPVAAYSNLGIAFRHEKERIASDAPWTPSDVISFSLAYDDTDRPAFPTDGSRRRIGLEKAGGFSPGLQYTKADLTWSHFLPARLTFIPTEMAQVVAVRINAGFADTRLPTSRQTELGGTMSIRGVDGVPVRQFALSNLEYRLQLVEGLQVTTFVDAGLDLDSVRMDSVVSSFGIELGINAAGVLVRMSMAWKMGEDFTWVPVFDFGFGQMF